MENLVHYHKMNEEIIKKNSKSFYLAFKQLDIKKRQAVFSIYSFCRIVDDIIDEDYMEFTLDEFKDEFEIFKTYINSDKLNSSLDSLKGSELYFLWITLYETFTLFEIELIYFDEMIEGQEFDRNFSGIEDLESLENYSYLVASTVGFMLLPILATKNYSKLQHHPKIIGSAFQITNILRDIYEDYTTRDRIYLPKSFLRKFDVKDADFKNFNTKNNPLNDVVFNLAKIADEKYTSIEKELFLFDTDSRLSLMSAFYYYRAILDKILKKHRYTNKRVYVSNIKKLMILQKVKHKIKHH